MKVLLFAARDVDVLLSVLKRLYFRAGYKTRNGNGNEMEMKRNETVCMHCTYMYLVAAETQHGSDGRIFRFMNFHR